MQFIKESTIDEYLYSPQSWLHRAYRTNKILYITILLICIPYLPNRYILFSLLFLLFIYEKLPLPNICYFYLYQIIFIFSVFILINVQNQAQIITGNIINRSYLQVYPKLISTISEKNQESIVRSYNIYYIPNSLFRLSIIYLIYWLIIKILLLTTLYQKILDIFINYFYQYIKLPIQKFYLETQIALQFSKIILKELKIMQISYATRGVEVRLKKNSIKSLFIYILFLQEFMQKVYLNADYIKQALYSGEIYRKYLNIIYQKKKVIA